MKPTLGIAALGLTAAKAMPSNLQRGSIEIRDPTEISKLSALNAEIQAKLRDGNATFIHSDHDINTSDLDKRIFAVFGLGGMALVELGGAIGGIAGGLANKLAGLFTDQDQEQIWANHGHCRVYFETDDGYQCEARGYARQSKDATNKHEFETCAWSNEGDPPITYFDNDEGIGRWSIQFTGTDKAAWGGTPDTEQCNFQGLCNPQLMFYRDGYAVVLNTWLSQGRVSACQYSDGEDCLGLCNSGVKDQFSPNGMKWGGDCAVPCIEDTDLPEV